MWMGSKKGCRKREGLLLVRIAEIDFAPHTSTHPASFGFPDSFLPYPLEWFLVEYIYIYIQENDKANACHHHVHISSFQLIYILKFSVIVIGIQGTFPNPLHTLDHK